MSHWLHQVEAANRAALGWPADRLTVPIGGILRWAGADVVCRNQPALRTAVPLRASAAPVAVTPIGDAPPLADASAEIDILGRTLYGEARGEGQAGMEAVAHVVYNRIQARSWWGRDVVGVCQKPWQFSCWNLNDPNRPLLLRLSAATPTFAVALSAAEAVDRADRAGTRAASDPTNSATHYYAPRVVAMPTWAIGRATCARIGAHHFC